MYFKVTNGAGLVSRSVSDPFIVDNTPPSSGHVIEVKSLNSMVRRVSVSALYKEKNTWQIMWQEAFVMI